MEGNKLAEINIIIAKNLKSLREEKKLSLEKVAELSGVSKTMIGQIERGESSPTITTLWKIANGLKISFSSIINHPQPETIVITKNDCQILTEENERFRVYPYFPLQDERRFEIYSVEIDKEGVQISEPHIEGTEEYITVYEGELTIRVDDLEYVVQNGDSIKFRSDKPHSYQNSGNSLLRMSMIIYYPV